MIINNFIGQKQEAISSTRCSEIVCELQEYASLNQNNVCYGEDLFQNRGALDRKDLQVFLPRACPEIYMEVSTAIFKGLEDYKAQISSVKDITLVSSDMKFQWTPVGGGYSVWHIEQNSGDASHRALAWTVYLNAIEDGGETEFLYQGMKVKPEPGKLVIWPAGITHPHRGNPPYSSEKFILTGWFELAPTITYSEALTALKEKLNA